MNFNQRLQQKQNLPVKKVYDKLLLTYFSQKVGIDMLEYFVETKLAKSLHGVAEERRSPTLTQPTYTSFLQGHTEAVDDSAIFPRVDLDATFDQIQRNHRRVCYPAAKDATKATQCIVLGRSILTAVRFCICDIQPDTVNHNNKHNN